MSIESKRYENMIYNRCGNSGLLLPAVSLGLWNNFGEIHSFANAKEMILRAFDLGVTHFDLANNYGPPPGSAEKTFGDVLRTELKSHRDEMVISTKAGYDMWAGPYGGWGSKKHLLASLDQSLTRMNLEYVDIFYSHRPDPDTPMEETMMALDQVVRQGKALYVGISNYNPEQTKQAIQILKSLGTPMIIHQASYSMFNRWVEDGLLDELQQNDVGCIAFSPLAQGLLTNRYLHDIPSDSRAAQKEIPFLNKEDINKEQVKKANELSKIAAERNQSLAQLALAWVLNSKGMTSVIMGASKVSQIEDNIAAVNNLHFHQDELKRIEEILS